MLKHMLIKIKKFRRAKKYIEFMGIGSAFIRKIISPGGNTLLVSREFDEIIGAYGHLFAFDFEMLKLLLTKWGFGKIRECKIGESSISDISKNKQSFVCGDRNYSLKDPFVKKKLFRHTNELFFYTGFDKVTNNQLIVEAVKIKNINYVKDNIFDDYFHRALSHFRIKLSYTLLKLFVIL